MLNGDIWMCKELFLYMGDTLDGDGGTDLAAIARIIHGWMKFRELLPFLTSRVPFFFFFSPLKMNGRLYASCVRTSMTVSETRPLLVDVGLTFIRVRCR